VTLIGPIVGELKRLGRRAGDAQATFNVPSTRGRDFASALLADGAGAERARLVIDNVVFSPRQLNAALGRPDPESWLAHETVIDAGAGGAPTLLAAAVSDGVDGWFVPFPGGFLLFVHHDEYSTVFAHKQGAVSRITTALVQAGFREVVGDER
jgi:hypothetical protein